ncbi:hypothetical protein PspLS_01669 [Pyricularia sp. CBS 133598]|nr:hypothetical protein PspLS_01669 [Pyricularia sp. CBS 133598]
MVLEVVGAEEVESWDGSYWVPIVLEAEEYVAGDRPLNVAKQQGQDGGTPASVNQRANFECRTVDVAMFSIGRCYIV